MSHDIISKALGLEIREWKEEMRSIIDECGI